MSEYIDREVAKKMLDEYRISRTMSMYGDMDLLTEWREGVKCSMKKLDEVPTADVVPKSEVIEIENKLRLLEDKLIQYEHVCGKVIIKDGVGIGLLPDGKETVYILKSIANVTKELAIRRTKQEVAREIFEEIEGEIKLALDSNYKARSVYNPTDEFGMWVQGKIDALRGIEDFLAELKKKYTE